MHAIESCKICDSEAKEKLNYDNAASIAQLTGGCFIWGPPGGGWGAGELRLRGNNPAVPASGSSGVLPMAPPGGKGALLAALLVPMPEGTVMDL